MADVELIMKIPEALYKDIKEHGLCGYSSDREIVSGAIANGRLLPKGHGRLIILSEDAIKREQTFLGFSCQSWISDVSLSDATVAIIEADAESEEKEE